MNQPLIIYHGGGCADGFTSAWIAARALGDVELLAVNYGQEPPKKSRLMDRDVYILDFSYSEEILESWVPLATRLVVLDHHKTAQEDLAPMQKKYDINEGHILIRFDMKKSGARLAWEYFRPGFEAPRLVQFVEDRDLWRWALDDSKAVNAYIRSWPFSLLTWDDLAWKLEQDDTFVKAIEQGGAILRSQDRMVDDHIKHAVITKIGEAEVLCVNATVLNSEIAGKLAEGMPFGACYFIRPDGKVQYSLRSREGGVDVSAVARTYGGGGHAPSAGFELDYIINPESQETGA